MKKVHEDTPPDTWSMGLVQDHRFAPLHLDWQPECGKENAWDALLSVRDEDGETARFAVYYQRDGTPKQVAFAAAQFGAIERRDDLLPLLLVPYLPEERLVQLEQQAVSALDLCGNGVLRAPGKFLVFRTGFPNRFTSSRPLKNVYRGVSSLVARAFLLRPEYAEIGDLYQEIARCDGNVSLPTLSKALTQLEDDLIVQRVRQERKPQARAVRLLQPEKLLSRLVENYAPPKIQRSFVGKVTLEASVLRSALQENVRTGDARMIATGTGSASRYATLAMENTLYVYTSSLDALLRDLPATSTNRFPNLSVQQTEDSTVFFDPRRDETGFPWASPITTYLELSQGEQRLAQTALQIRSSLLSTLQENHS